MKRIEFGRERPTLESDEAIKVFEERVNKFVTDSLDGYKPERHVKGSKSIRDAIWGQLTDFTHGRLLSSTVLFSRDCGTFTRRAWRTLCIRLLYIAVLITPWV